MLFFFLIVSLHADSLRAQIANMLFVGFSGTSLDRNSSLYRTIHDYSLGGIILFSSNLQHKTQTKALTDTLQTLHNKRLFIALDQEGGYVDRLAKIKGCFKTPAAQNMAHIKRENAKKIYLKMAKEMRALGFNLTFAPVVDLALNPKNRVIVGFKRSFGKDPKTVIKYASCFINAMHEKGILTTLKHFPGHGTSYADSHKGFTDVSDTWQQKELVPYLKLIDANKSDLIMSAHIYNRHLDDKYPATLSYKTITSLLKQQMHYGGIVISDDMQMGAIRKNYGLKESIALAINAGVDMLLFGNQLGNPCDVSKLISIIETLVKEGTITTRQIQRANRRINRVKAKL